MPFVNLVRAHLQAKRFQLKILEFNAWIFGADQLISTLFEELTTLLDIGDSRRFIEEYGLELSMPS